MYLIAACPPIIPALMVFPILIALRYTKTETYHPITSNLKIINFRFFLGIMVSVVITTLLYSLGIGEDGVNNDWDPVLMSGIILPVLIGGLSLMIYERIQLRPLNFSRGGIWASVYYFLIIVLPFLAPWILRSLYFPYFGIIVATFVPSMFGLWLLLSVSTYNRKYYLAFTISSFLSLFLYIAILAGLSSQ